MTLFLPHIWLKDLHQDSKSPLKWNDGVLGLFCAHCFRLNCAIQIPFEGSKPSNEPPNLISAKHHPEIVDNNIKKEPSLNHISGPYDSPPFLEMVISPIGVIPKKQPGTFRMIHHLSYPRGLSINHGISKEHTSCSPLSHSGWRNRYAVDARSIKMMVF